MARVLDQILVDVEVAFLVLTVKDVRIRFCCVRNAADISCIYCFKGLLNPFELDRSQ